MSLVIPLVALITSLMSVIIAIRNTKEILKTEDSFNLLIKDISSDFELIEKTKASIQVMREHGEELETRLHERVNTLDNKYDERTIKLAEEIRQYNEALKQITDLSQRLDIAEAKNKL